MRNDIFTYEHYRAPLELIVQQASDIDLWNAVFDLIITVSRTTTHTSTSVSSDGTPITHSSASQPDREQTQKTVEARIFEEIRRCTHQNVERFLFKYLREDLGQGVARLSIKLYKRDIWKDDGSTFLRLQYKMRSANEPGAYFTSTTRDLKGGKIRPQYIFSRLADSSARGFSVGTIYSHGCSIALLHIAQLLSILMRSQSGLSVRLR